MQKKPTPRMDDKDAEGLLRTVVKNSVNEMSEGCRPWQPIVSVNLRLWTGPSRPAGTQVMKKDEVWRLNIHHSASREMRKQRQALSSGTKLRTRPGTYADYEDCSVSGESLFGRSLLTMKTGGNL